MNSYYDGIEEFQPKLIRLAQNLNDLGKIIYRHKVSEAEIMPEPSEVFESLYRSRLIVNSDKFLALRIIRWTETYIESSKTMTTPSLEDVVRKGFILEKHLAKVVYECY